jgi:hypothetical protein
MGHSIAKVQKGIKEGKLTEIEILAKLTHLMTL